jgi:outer membrane protein assembly factor BamD
MSRSLFFRAAVLVLSASVVAAPAFASDKDKKAKPAPAAVPANSKQPDKVLYDKAMDAMKHGKYDVARLQLQALLNTYPESEYQMRAKLAIGDTWYKEGDAASMTQAENEYKDFITFFPTAPEAAQAQMRVADIYYKQMDKPDRDFKNALRAEQEYRIMIQQFPDSKLVPQARQRLREVQEVLAERQFEIGFFYSTHENWAGTIARYQTVADTYPLFSKSDQVLIGLGDAYMGEVRNIQTFKGSEKSKSVLIKAYQDKAAAEYGRVLTRYPLSDHAGEAKAKLVAMGRPIPHPTAAELAESRAEMESRAPVTLTSRARLLISHNPTVLEAARVGEPDMDPPPATVAPDITKQNVALFTSLLHPTAPAAGATGSAAAGTPPTTDQPAAAGAAPSATPSLSLEQIPADTNTTSSDSNSSSTDAAPAATPAGVSDSSSAPPAAAADSSAAPAEQPAAAAAPSGTPMTASTPAAGNSGLAPVGPPNTSVPPIDKPAAAPMQVNEVHNNPPNPAAAQTDKKGHRPKVDKSDESDSKKKKKGLAKLF